VLKLFKELLVPPNNFMNFSFAVRDPHRDKDLNHTRVFHKIKIILKA
jgi:hypothetical protein